MTAGVGIEKKKVIKELCYKTATKLIIGLKSLINVLDYI